MTISLSRQQLVELVQGSVRPSTERLSIVGIATNPTLVRGGELFLPVVASPQEARRQVLEAFERGASLMLTSDAILAQDFSEPHRIVLVPSVLDALRRIASWWRTELGLPLVAVSGTLGKTTVKELLASILLRTGLGGFTEGTANDEVGVLETICRLSRDHEWAVVEIGNDVPGMTSRVSALIRPNVGVIVSTAPRYLDRYHNLEALVDECLGILRGMSPTAPLILGRFEEQTRRVVMARNTGGVRPVFDFGESADCDLSFSAIATRGFEGISLELKSGSEVREVAVRVLGGCHAANVACAALAARTVFPALSLDEIAAGLSHFRAPLQKVYLGGGGETVTRAILDDTAEASPVSMSGFLKFGGELARLNQRVCLLLGAMPDLGRFTASYHTSVAREIARQPPVAVLAADSVAMYLAEDLSRASIPLYEIRTVEEALDVLSEIQYTALLIKGKANFDLSTVASVLGEQLEAEPSGLNRGAAFFSSATGEDLSDVLGGHDRDGDIDEI